MASSQPSKKRRRTEEAPPANPSAAPTNLVVAASPPSLAEADFLAYVRFRILESIGYPGTFRKFMQKRREQGLDWAARMATHVAAAQQGTKALGALEQEIKLSRTLKSLHMVWQHVVESNTPPSDLQLTIGTCIITGKPNVPCIVIKGKGRGANSFTVSSKFAAFLYHLWIIYKMDVLVKVYARTILEAIDPQSAMPLNAVVALIAEREHELVSMARSFHAAYSHVCRSAMGGLLAVV